MPTDNTITFTGNLGPGIAVEGLEIPNVRRLEFDFTAQCVNAYDESGNIKQLQFSNVDTVTFAFPDGVGGRVTVAIEEA